MESCYLPVKGTKTPFFSVITATHESPCTFVGGDDATLLWSKLGALHDALLAAALGKLITREERAFP